MLLLPLIREPSPVSFDQSTVPSLRDRHMASSFFVLLSRLLTNTRSPQPIGGPGLGPGLGAVQATFVSLSILSGSPAASPAPLKCGPRHCGQFSARAAGDRAQASR